MDQTRARSRRAFNSNAACYEFQNNFPRSRLSKILIYSDLSLRLFSELLRIWQDINLADAQNIVMTQTKIGQEDQDELDSDDKGDFMIQTNLFTSECPLNWLLKSWNKYSRMMLNFKLRLLIHGVL